MSKQVKKTNNTIKKFKWPDSIKYNDEIIVSYKKEPNFASYITGKHYMNKLVYVTRVEMEKWLNSQQDQ